MQKNKKTIIILIVLLVLTTLVIIGMFRSEQEALTEDPEQSEIMESADGFNEADTLNRIGLGDEIEDIEEDLRLLSEELNEMPRLLDNMEMEIDEL